MVSFEASTRPECDLQELPYRKGHTEMTGLLSAIGTWLFFAIVVLAFSKAIMTWDQTRTDFYNSFIERNDNERH